MRRRGCFVEDWHQRWKPLQTTHFWLRFPEGFSDYDALSFAIIYVLAQGIHKCGPIELKWVVWNWQKKRKYWVMWPKWSNVLASKVNPFLQRMSPLILRDNNSFCLEKHTMPAIYFFCFFFSPKSKLLKLKLGFLNADFVELRRPGLSNKWRQFQLWDSPDFS